MSNTISHIQVDYPQLIPIVNTPENMSAGILHRGRAFEWAYEHAFETLNNEFKTPSWESESVDSDKEPQSFACYGVIDEISNILDMWSTTSKKSTSSDRITLELYTRSSNRTIIAEKGALVDIHRSNFNAERKTVVISHGFFTGPNTEWLPLLVNAYLIHEDVNIIILDWNMFTTEHSYIEAASNVQNVAQQVADLFMDIFNEFPKTTSWPDLHLIGFSLGAHVMANVARKFHHSQWKIGRITGLDPASPCYEKNPWKLKKEDAPYVDVIHTNADANSTLPFGLVEPAGHLDFYVNGGEIQPGCEVPYDGWDILMDAVLPGLRTSKCSHTRAVMYFIESLEIANANKKSPLMGIKWNLREIGPAVDFLYNNTCVTKCMPMGITAHNRDEDAFGVYFVPAGAKKPFTNLSDEDRYAIERVLKRN